MAHHWPVVSLSHALADHLFAAALPGPKKGKKARGVAQHFEEQVSRKVVHATHRISLADGTKVALHFSTVNNTVFAALDHEVE